MTRPADERLRNGVRTARTERSVSQVELGRMVGVSRQTISSIETADYTPSALLAFRIARVLDVPVDRLFWLEEVG
jgi:putative transcriptional regulator